MKLEITLSGVALMDAIINEIGNDYDSLVTALRTVRWITIEGDGDIEDVASDEWIEDQYKNRFDGADYKEMRDTRDAAKALAAGNVMVARALFERGGREDIARVI